MKSKNAIEKKMNLTIILSLIMMFFIMLISCGKLKEKPHSTGKIRVTTTTTMLTDLVKTIGGDKVEVTGLMGEGKMTDVFEKLSTLDKAILNVGSKLDKKKVHLIDGKTPDPHVWFNTEMWETEARAVAVELGKFDAKNKDYYMKNFENYKIKLDELTNYVKKRIEEIPPKSRVLVTAHDAFNYFGEQFGLEVRAIQGVSTDSETGTKNISDLANFIAERNIKAVFVESSVPKKSIEALQEAVKARGKEIKIGGELYSDSLGDKQHNAETYIKTVKANADTIVNALK